MQNDKPFERINYYFGKMMTVGDFQDEQLNLNEKRWILNRLGLGWGVVCGLKVTAHEQAKNKVVIEQGFALDQYGHEIKVCRDNNIVDLMTAEGALDPEKPNLYYVFIKYRECPINPSPFPIEDCGDYKEERVYNRTLETYEFKVKRQASEIEYILTPDLKEQLKCETDCLRLLKNPAPIITAGCPAREACSLIPLARVCYYKAEDGKEYLQIDNNFRRLVFSNELLYEFIQCLTNGLNETRAARYDRRRYVPLLATTIKGLTYQDGKIAKIDASLSTSEYKGKIPYRLTSDGEFIWITDKGDKQIWRIDRRTNKPIADSQSLLDYPAWGLAFDGHYMWITHPNAPRPLAKSEISTFNQEKVDTIESKSKLKFGIITRINVCNLSDKISFFKLPPVEIDPVTHKINWNNKCQQFSDVISNPENDFLPEHPKEIVFHKNYIYVALAKGKGLIEAEKTEHSAEMNTDSEQGMEKQEEMIQINNICLAKIHPGTGRYKIIDIPDIEGYRVYSEIISMVSDGDVLWIIYMARDLHPRKPGGSSATLLLRKIEKIGDEEKASDEVWELLGDADSNMTFDGTHLWVTHTEGCTRIDLNENDSKKKFKTTGSETEQTAIAYGGSDFIWSVTNSTNETKVNKINIYSVKIVDDIEYYEHKNRNYKVNDMQFDGNFLYIAACLTDHRNKYGVIHRLLP